MIELKENDLLQLRIKETKEICFSVIIKVNEDGSCRYLRDTAFGHDTDFMDDNKRVEVKAVWRFDAETGNFLKIYDKEELCQTVKPADVPYDKYISLEHENTELRNIIVELNKKLYENNQIH